MNVCNVVESDEQFLILPSFQYFIHYSPVTIMKDPYMCALQFIGI